MIMRGSEVKSRTGTGITCAESATNPRQNGHNPRQIYHTRDQIHRIPGQFCVSARSGRNR